MRASYAPLALSAILTTLLPIMPHAQSVDLSDPSQGMEGADLPQSPPASEPSTVSNDHSSDTAIQYSLQGEVGILGNFASPRSGINYGHLFQDHANAVLLNQILGTIRKPVAHSGVVNIGFDVQAMYGSDARYDLIQGVDDG